MPTDNITVMCGEGSHESCDGWGTHHYNHPEEDRGVVFTCACGHHYVPPSLGEVAVPERPGQELPGEEPEEPGEPEEEGPVDVPDVVLGSD